jgi:hypothetical protein
MNTLLYLLQVNLYLLLFYVLYLVLLRNETFFKMNRFYLVGSALLSLGIPLLKLQWVKELFTGKDVFQVRQKISNVIENRDFIGKPFGSPAPTIGESATTLSNLQLVGIIYGLVTLFFLLNFIRNLYLLNTAMKSPKKKKAFSFFKTVIVDDELEGKDTIVDHEMVHVRQWHSLDVIFFEVFTAFNWFNPVAFLYRKAIKDIHEFIADDIAASRLDNRSNYTLLLVSNVFGAKPQELTNSFFNQSLLKRRIIMLHKTKSRQVAILKYGLSVPLFASMVIFSSATATAENMAKAMQNSQIVEALSEAKPIPIQEIETPSLIRQVSAEKKPKSVVAKPGDTKIRVSNQSVDPEKSNAQNLMDYLSRFRSKQSPFDNEYAEGVSYYSFDVDDHKIAKNFKVIKSVSPNKEARLLIHLAAFKDTVSLKKGTYNFYQGEHFGFAGDDPAKYLDKDISVIFGSISILNSEFITRDETNSEAGRIVNYLRVPTLTAPVILVDGKVISYKVKDALIELGETIDRKQQKIDILTGDAAVAAYNESARNGLILITTVKR